MRKLFFSLIGLCVLALSTYAANWNDVAGVTPIEKARPAGVTNGIYYGEDGTSVTLCTYAASKTQSAKRVFLLGDMTDWKLSADYQLYKDGNYFWITLTGLTPGQEYRFQYAVERADGVKKQISDLYSEKVLHPDDQYEPKKVDPDLLDYPTGKGADGYVTVIQPGKPQFEWSDATLNFKRPNKNNLVIYELWIYDYTEGRSLKGLMKRLDYIQNLGVNAVELMPICEFDGNYNWGYSPNHYFAPDRAYGSETMYKEFIDECHKRGIAVILDMVFNHATGNNPMNKLYPYGTDLASNPWFNVNAPHSDNVYEDWNHGFAPAHEMFIRALQYWLTEYKVDGYSERPQLVNYGMQCWSNTTNAYCQTAMGWLQDGDGLADASKDGYVSYCESHDEERMQYKAKKYGNGDLQTNTAARLGRVAENVAFNVLLNGSHMLWMWEEIGYDFSINCDLDHPNAENESYRCNKKPRPEIRGYFTKAERVAAFTKCAQVITLRTQLIPEVFEGNPNGLIVGSGRALRRVQWGSNVIAVANFGVTGNQSYTVPSGTWYDYLDGGTPAAATYTLAPGELKVFTGTQIAPPTFSDISKRDHTPIDNVETDAPKAYKIIRDGQVLIVRGDKTYTITGSLVQ